jgi:hypothetical protein
MKFPRIRMLVALLALFTLSAPLAQAAWAFGCDAMGSGSTMSHTCHSGATAPDHGTGDTESSHPSAPPCPMAAAASCVPGFLPAQITVRKLEIPAEAPVLAAADATPVLLLISSLFRPPRP